MVPLLSSAPLAQNELVSTSNGWTVLVSRFHSAPQAEWLLIWSGSFEARSKKIARVGETTIDSRATMPELTSFKSKVEQILRDTGMLDARAAKMDKDDILKYAPSLLVTSPPEAALNNQR